MRAAQNPVQPVVDVVTAIPAGVVDLVMILPPWLRVPVVAILLLLVTFGVFGPRLVRMYDDHRFALKARECITQPEHWVEVLRIRNEPRRQFGLRGLAADAPSDGSPPPGNAAPTRDLGDDPP